MSSLTKTDFAVANWWARVVNEVRYRLGFKSGKHRSLGLSTYEWVRMSRVARDC